MHSALVGGGGYPREVLMCSCTTSLLLKSSSPPAPTSSTPANADRITSDTPVILPPEGAAYQVGGGADSDARRGLVLVDPLEREPCACGAVPPHFAKCFSCSGADTPLQWLEVASMRHLVGGRLYFTPRGDTIQSGGRGSSRGLSCASRGGYGESLLRLFSRIHGAGGPRSADAGRFTPKPIALSHASAFLRRHEAWGGVSLSAHSRGVVESCGYLDALGVSCARLRRVQVRALLDAHKAPDIDLRGHMRWGTMCGSRVTVYSRVSAGQYARDTGRDTDCVSRCPVLPLVLHSVHGKQAGSEGDPAHRSVGSRIPPEIAHEITGHHAQDVATLRAMLVSKLTPVLAIVQLFSFINMVWNGTVSS
ncbi:hypothetical protein B0H13DRAFT_2384126 [Mycena leptocephala]|nr:hypothetical protein B0H13DRAFT_2384126 [Mycena leptocephala]